MKAIVVYNSKTGFTKKYGEWIAQEIGCDAVPYKKEMNGISDYDTVIYGGGIMAGKVNGLDAFKSKVQSDTQKLIVYATGATDFRAMDVIAQMRNSNLTEKEQKSTPFFYFEGGINYDEMSVGSKLITKMLYKMLKNKKDKTPEEAGMAQALEHSFDHSDRKSIIGMTTMIKEMVS